VRNRFDDIASIQIRTQEPAIRIISKKGTLKNPADRDHCLEYMVAVGLGLGRLEATDYEEHIAKKPVIENLRRLMNVKEDPQFTKDYYDLGKRAIGNAIKIEFKDGTSTDWVEEHYPIGHPKRREEGLPLLKQKFLQNLRSYYSEEQLSHIREVFLGDGDWLKLSIDDFYRLFQK
jgi:2-methylcitrate dehydratase